MDDKTLARFWSKVDRNGPTLREELGPCWVWTGSRFKEGYGRFQPDSRRAPGGGRIGKIKLAHRMSWFLTYGRWPEDCALHKCDGGTIGCVRPDHLFEGTREDNNKDRTQKGRSSPPAVRCVSIRGEGHPNARLTANIVSEIRARSAAGASRGELASAYGISSGYVRDIVKRNNWKHVP